MKYKGWYIAAEIMMPRCFYIKDVSENMNIEYSTEVQYSPKQDPKKYHPYNYLASKGDKWLSCRTMTGLKKLIYEENLKNE